MNTTNTGLLIDLDGVIYQGENALNGAAETISWVRQANIPYLFVTNTTSRPRKAIVEKLHRLGLQIEAGAIFTPPMAACEWLSSHTTGPVKLYVRDKTLDDFASIPKLDREDENPEAIVIGDYSDRWTFSALNDAFLYLMNEPRPHFIALGLTRYWRAQEGLRLDVGPFIKALEYASGAKAIILGKPCRDFFGAALSILGCKPSDTYMIGDDIIGDIDGAQLAGIKGILVRTGKFRPSDLKGKIQPNHIIDSIADLPKLLDKKN